jgi:cardiolipin synthase
VTTPAAVAAQVTRSLPAADVERLATAVAHGAAAVLALRGAAGSPQLRWACDLVATVDVTSSLSGALRGAAAVRAEQQPSVDVVWGGPDSRIGGGRLTSAVITEALDAARTDVLVVGYAVHDEPSVVAALQAAVGRGVELTLLCERPADNPRFTGAEHPFPGLAARRLSWPGAARPTGTSLHAKVLVIDQRVALIGSANLTGAALGRNLECGVLITDGPVPRRIVQHVEDLAALGVLRPT